MNKLTLSARDRAVIGERDVTGKYKNISLIGWDIYNFHSNQIVEIFDLPDGKDLL